jgi:hypothetical protein
MTTVQDTDLTPELVARRTALRPDTHFGCAYIDKNMAKEYEKLLRDELSGEISCK